MPWMQTDRRFPDRSAILTIGRLDRRENAAFDMVLSLLERVDHTPEQLQETLEKLVVAARPELENCMVWWIDMKVHEQRWDIGVMHPSFPTVAPGCHAERQSLIREEVLP